MNIGILFGGRSAEHEVSCLSAYSIYQNIDRERFTPILIGITKNGEFKYYDDRIDHLLDATWEFYSSSVPVDIIGLKGGPSILFDEPLNIDCIFPVLHGPFGEDGRIQGVLEYAGIPYVGCGVLSSALCMDKVLTKDLLKLNGIPQTRYVLYERGELLEDLQQKISSFAYPLFVKPSNLGSSVGISKVNRAQELGDALDIALQYDRRVIIEEGVDAREIEVAVLRSTEEMIISAPGELIIQDGFYDYETKYKKNTTTWKIPADLRQETTDMIRSLAKKVFALLGCKGLARVDFFVERNSGKVLLNEVNTMPGFTEISMYPKLIMNEGIDYKTLISRSIDLAMEEYE